jgi:hypothetical protein
MDFVTSVKPKLSWQVITVGISETFRTYFQLIEVKLVMPLGCAALYALTGLPKERR